MKENPKYSRGLEFELWRGISLCWPLQPEEEMR